MIEITRPLMTLLHSDGTPVEGVSRSTSEVEAMEKASGLPVGVYILDRPPATISVTCGASEPEEPVGVPFGDLAALQALGLLPEYRAVKTVSLNEDVDWRGHGGERAEIGYLPEDHAGFIAGQSELLPGILEIADQPPGGLDFAHHPNLYWLPFLMTGDVKYVRHMEMQHQQFMAWRNRALGDSFHTKTAGRELAWNLRDLFQLVWCQDRGYTAGDTYRATYEATRDEYLAIMANPRPEVETFRVIKWNFETHDSYMWSGWMESFVGIVENIGIQMGFEDWRPIAEFHYENLERRIAFWGWKGFDNNYAWAWKLHPEQIGALDPSKNPIFNTPDYVSLMHWGTDLNDDLAMLPFERPMMEAEPYASRPDDELLPINLFGGYWYTYANRGQSAYMWAAMAAKSGTDSRAESTAQTLYQKIIGRGDSWEARHAIKGPQ